MITQRWKNGIAEQRMLAGKKFRTDEEAIAETEYDFDKSYRFCIIKNNNEIGSTNYGG